MQLSLLDYMENALLELPEEKGPFDYPALAGWLTRKRGQIKAEKLKILVRHIDLFIH